MPDEILLREVVDADLPAFFEHESDPIAVQMAAFTAEDPNDHDAFIAHWAKIRANDAVTIRTILYSDRVVGHIASFNRGPDREVTYWIDRAHWSRGIATRALAEFLKLEQTRPLHARAAKDNVASLRVLEKCGFEMSAQERGFANARGQEIDELVLRLDQ